MSKSKINRWFNKLLNQSPLDSYKGLQVKLGFKKITEFDDYIWCLSTGRVGSKTVSELLSLDASALSAHEPSPKLFGLGKISYAKSDIDDSILEAINIARNNIIGYDQKRYIETSPQVTFLAYHLLKVFPNSKFIHLVRNPVDVVNSGVKRKWYNGNTTDQWRIVPSKKDPIYTEWDKFDSISKNIWSWVETNKWIVEFCNTLPKENVMILKSEELFKNNKEEITKLSIFCNCRKLDEKRVQKVIYKKSNSNISNGFSGNVEWSSSHYDLLLELGSELLEKFDYKIKK